MRTPTSVGMQFDTNTQEWDIVEVATTGSVPDIEKYVDLNDILISMSHAEAIQTYSALPETEWSKDEQIMESIAESYATEYGKKYVGKIEGTQ